MYKLSKKQAKDLATRLDRLVDRGLWSEVDEIIPKTYYTFDTSDLSDMEIYTTLSDARGRAFGAYRQYLADRYLRPAKKGEYEQWLMGYLIYTKKPQVRKIGQPWDLYEDDMFVATRDFRVEMRLMGVSSLHIIVPEDVKFLDSLDRLGHTTLYYNRDFTFSGGANPPVFNDLTFDQSYG